MLDHTCGQTEMPVQVCMSAHIGICKQQCDQRMSVDGRNSFLEVKQCWGLNVGWKGVCHTGLLSLLHRGFHWDIAHMVLDKDGMCPQPRADLLRHVSCVFRHLGLAHVLNRLNHAHHVPIAAPNPHGQCYKTLNFSQASSRIWNHTWRHVFYSENNNHPCLYC